MTRTTTRRNIINPWVGDRDNVHPTTIQHPAQAMLQHIQALGAQRKWNQLLQFYQNRDLRYFNHVHYAVLLHQFSTHQNPKGLYRNSSFLAFAQDLVSDLELVCGPAPNKNKTISPHFISALADIAQALGHVSLRNDTTMRFVHLINRPDLAESLVQHGEPRQIAHTCWGLAQLMVGQHVPQQQQRQLPTTFFSLVDEASVWLVQQGAPHEISTTVRAFATVGVTPQQLLEEIDQAAPRYVQNGSTQNVADMAWAFATLGVTPQQLLNEIDKHSTRLVQNGSPQDVAHLVWAFATLDNVTPQNLLQDIDDAAVWLVKEGTPRDVTVTLGAFCKLDVVRPTRLLDEVDKACDWLIREGTPKAVATAAVSFAALGVKSPRLFRKIDDPKVAHWLVQEGAPKAVAETVAAFATCGIQPQHLLDEIEQGCARLVQKGTKQDLAEIVAAFQSLGREPPHEFVLSAQEEDDT